MAITKSAKKALRQSFRKKGYNDVLKHNLRAALKGVREAKAGDTQAVAAAYKAIDKAHKHGLIKTNTAARRKALAAKLARAK